MSAPPRIWEFSYTTCIQKDAYCQLIEMNKQRNSVLGIGSFKLGHVLRHVPLCVGIGFVIIQKNMYWICNSACGLLPRRAATAIGYVSKFEGIYFTKLVLKHSYTYQSPSQKGTDQFMPCVSKCVQGGLQMVKIGDLQAIYKIHRSLQANNSNLIHLKLGSFIHISKGINTMASRQDIGNKAGEITSQAQVKKDELLDQASDAAHSAQNSSPNLTGQATNFLQQTGEQVKHMAQGAAVAVKNTLGLNTDSPNSTNYRSNTNSPSNPNTASNINNPSYPNTESNIDNPSYPNTTSNINNPSNPSTRI